jgi:serine protease Do
MTPSKGVVLALAAGAVGAGLLATGPTSAQRAPDAPATLGSGMAGPMARAPLTFADIVERVKPAVVSISVTGSAPRPSQVQRRGPQTPDLFPNIPEDHPLYEFFKGLPRGGQGQPNPTPRSSQGSGFLISADGLVVTNNHVIDGGGKIQVSFSKSRRYDAELVGTDSRTDLALLRIKPKQAGERFAFVRFAERETRVGDWVVAVGNPFGLGGTVTAGIVSAHGRDIGSGPYDFLQIDAAVNRGNSGGPTFNLEGEVVGVNTAIYSPSGGNVGIAFAVPAKTAVEVVSQLQKGGSVARGWLGVKIQNIDEDTAASLGLKEARGALVSEITPKSPAEAAGLRVRDVVLSVNNEKIGDSRELARKVAEFRPNVSVDVRVLRDGREQVVPVKLGTFPSGKELARAEQGSPTTTAMDRLGLTVAPAPRGRNGEPAEGVVVTAVESGSDAAEKGLRVGDVILDVNGSAANTPADVSAAVENAQKLGRPSVLLRIKSGQQTRFVPVRLQADAKPDKN